MENKILGKEIVVELGEEKIVVKKLALGKYAKVLGILKNVKMDFGKFQNLNTDDAQSMIHFFLEMIETSWEHVIEIIAVGTGIDKERLKEDETIGLDGGIQLLFAVWEVNNLGNVVKSTKNFMKAAGR